MANVQCFGSVRIFGACVAVVFFLHGALLQYSVNVVEYIGRRYDIARYEQNFIIGVQAIGFVIVLLVAAFFGNRMNRPHAVAAGNIICAAGSWLCGCVYFITGHRKYGTWISDYVLGGACNISAPSTVKQCHLLQFPNTKTIPFSIICLGQFLIGVGSALYASLSFAHIEENCKQRHESALLIGIILAMHGLGQFVGTMFAVGFNSLPESVSGDHYLVSEMERVGAWWLGFPVIGTLMLVMATTFFCFPEWFNQPDWLKRRNQRYKEKQRASLTAKQSRKHVVSKKEHRRGIDRHGKKADDAQQSSSLRRRKRSRKRSSVEACNGEVPVDKKTTTGKPDEQEAHATVSEDVAVQIHDDAKQGKATPARTSQDVDKETPGSLSDRNGDIPDTEHYQEVSVAEGMADVGVISSTQGDNNAFEGADEDVPVGQTTTQEDDIIQELGDDDPEPARPDTKYSKRTQSEKEKEKRKRKRQQLRKQEEKRRVRTRKYIVRKEQVKDLPRHVWRLARNPVLLIAILGSVLGAYLYTGYVATLKTYITVQFHRSPTTSAILAGVAGQLSWSLGAVISGIVVFKRRPSLYESTRTILVCILVAMVLLAILMAFKCPAKSERMITRDSESPMDLPCHAPCDCITKQVEMVCADNHVTFLSPCQAGCKFVQPGDELDVFIYGNCSCTPGGRAQSGACQESCPHLVAFIIFVFVSVCVHSVGQVPVMMIFLRKIVKDRYCSLSVGFAIWTIFILGYIPGPVVFRALRHSQCELGIKDCYEEDECLVYKLNNYNYLQHGTAMLFQAGSLLAFLVVFILLRKDMKRRRVSQEPGDSPSGKNLTIVENGEGGMSNAAFDNIQDTENEETV